jgi:hypothetical protein
MQPEETFAWEEATSKKTIYLDTQKINENKGVEDIRDINNTPTTKVF